MKSDLVKKIKKTALNSVMTKGAVMLSSFAVVAAVYSFEPFWYDQRKMPDALKKKLR